MVNCIDVHKESSILNSLDVVIYFLVMLFFSLEVIIFDFLFCANESALPHPKLITLVFLIF